LKKGQEYNPDLPDGDGDCFVTHAQFVLGLTFRSAPDIDRWRLCHGIAIGQGPISGVEFAHCWLEKGIGDIYSTTVTDMSNGNDIYDLPAVVYYSIGNIAPSTVMRYTAEETRKNMLKHQHYGPWASLKSPTEEVRPERKPLKKVPKAASKRTKKAS